MRHLNLACIAFATLVFNGGLATAGESTSADPHAAHRKMMREPTTSVKLVDYQIPNVDLVDASGRSTNLQDLLSADKPVVVNFIFTTCTTICPVITATTLQLQRQLVDDAVQPAYISISIDPDYDSSAVLKEYAEAYGADWTFLTGSPADVHTALQAFNAYYGNKVNHFALTLMHTGKSAQWTRVEGLTSAQELADIWRSASL